MNLKILPLVQLQCLRLILLFTLIFGLMLSLDDGSSIAAQKVGKPGFIDPINADITSNQLQVVEPPVTGLTSTLSDEVKELPTELIRWSTYWQLCWQPYPEAKEYELQAVLMEGKSPKLRRQSDRCFRIQAASNENQKSLGLLNRELILLTHKIQLGYRVRAVLDDNHVSQWSEVMAVGATNVI
ncbi:hypothetical protein [Nostoc sphaeroides]|jgi:hypothetical protein|uniref:Uncharacterized protein n=1 Tax=Nostoc sphaeroides CCNUC1 TaxID=2653204 RepID=A0A5P8W619_9NOSO|nr:hypothetical protein [Nostoc sphaeroides]MCC5631455.1 hypothetical protein [Nostoc sphaeroides CHAB 2801]QFS47716.1 hypothetical protein GXM_05208 [Nostoc sphaeroides CCNUC1]